MNFHLETRGVLTGRFRNAVVHGSEWSASVSGCFILKIGGWVGSKTGLVSVAKRQIPALLGNHILVTNRDIPQLSYVLYSIGDLCHWLLIKCLARESSLDHCSIFVCHHTLRCMIALTTQYTCL